MRLICLILALFVLLRTELRAAPPVAQRVAEPSVSARPSDTQSILRSGDVFEMKISGVAPDVVSEFTNSQYTIGSEGMVKITYIGRVQAVGMTPAQLAEAIEAKFVAGKIFTNPTVVINVAAVPRFVSVSGGVRAPQRLQWLAEMTLSSAVGNCQGLSDFGSPKGVKLVRDGRILAVFNLKDIEKDPSRDVKLLPGDQVVVPGG